MSGRAVDPGSSASVVKDPRGALDLLQEMIGVQFEHLAQAAEHTAQKAEAKAAALSGTHPSVDMSIVLFGSWARNELTEGSDDD